MLSLEDERDISALILRYADAMDRRDWTRFCSCFTNDFAADYGAGAIWSSSEEITAFMENLYRELGTALHRITNIVIRENGENVAVRSYVHGLSTRRDGTVAMDVEGYYDDLVVKVEGDWKIKNRRFVAARIRRDEPISGIASPAPITS